MEIIRPFTVTDANLAATNVPEIAPTAYAGGTTYALAAIVSVTVGLIITAYQSLQAANLGNAPASSPTFWKSIATTYVPYSASTLYVAGDVAISTTTHHEYQSLVGVSLGTATMTIAVPCVVTRVAHGLTANTPVLFTTTGALPTGLVVNTVYYVVTITTDTFQVSATSGGAAITTTGTQSGVHTLYSNPNKGYALTDAVRWLDLGSDNRWRMFDQSNSSQTSVGEKIDVSVQVTGRADSVALLNIVAASVQIKATTIDGLIYDTTFNLVSSSGVSNWYDYFFEPIIRRGDQVTINLPLNSDPLIQVIMLEPGGTAKCGTMVIGQSLILGGLVYGATVGIQDYSRKVADAFGNYTIVQRAFAKRATFKVAMAGSKVDAAAAFLASVRAIPVVYKGTDLYTSTFIYGFFKNWTIEIAHPDVSYCTLDVEGLT
jgi:hypothetical protein